MSVELIRHNCNRILTSADFYIDYARNGGECGIEINGAIMAIGSDQPEMQEAKSILMAATGGAETIIQQMERLKQLVTEYSARL